MNQPEIQTIIKDYYDQLHGNKPESLEKMDQLRETYNPPRLNHKEIEIVSRLIISQET